MHQLAKKLMMARKLKFGEDGKAEVLDQDFVFLDGQLILSILDKAGEVSSHEIGKEVGKKITSDLQKTGLTGSKLLNFTIDLLTMSGLGQFNIEKFNLTSKQGEISIKNSLPARNTTSKDKKCYFTAGIISGMFKTSYKTSFECQETACAAQGSPICKFNFKPT